MSVKKCQRPQIKWNIHNDNSVLICHPTQTQVDNVYNFKQNIHQYYNRFITLSLQLASAISLYTTPTLQLVNQPYKFKELLSAIKQKGYVFLDVVTDFSQSYKGWISWLIITFNSSGYLIDGLALHNQLKEMKNILQSSQIVKYCYSETIILEDAKRDWNAFGVNFFNFQFMNDISRPKRTLRMIRRSDYLISPELLQELKQRYASMMKDMKNIRGFLNQWSQQFSVLSYANYPKLLLEPYQHKPLNFFEEKEIFLVQQRQQRRYRQREQKQNNCQQNYVEIEGNYSISNSRNQALYQLLYEWREHKAKIMDYPPTRLLNLKQILQIVQNRPKSFNRMQMILKSKDAFYLQFIEQIIQILALQTEQFQDEANKLKVDAPYRKDDHNIRRLLSQLQCQSGQQWLNRKNDESIRLYKEIISIQELDESVVEEFMKGMGSGAVGKTEIHRFVKYAQFLKQGNHKGLQEYYQGKQKLEKGYESRDSRQEWNDEDQDSYIVDTNKSQTSLADSIDKEPEKLEPLTATTFNSDFQILSSNKHKDLPALPKNIEQIYRKAATVKKGYQKIQKKKSGRRQSGEENQALVPSWQQFKCFLNGCK